MQSTGHTSTQLASLVPMHGSAITYGMRCLLPQNSAKFPVEKRCNSAHAPVQSQGSEAGKVAFLEHSAPPAQAPVQARMCALRQGHINRAGDRMSFRPFGRRAQV